MKPIFLLATLAALAAAVPHPDGGPIEPPRDNVPKRQGDCNGDSGRCQQLAECDRDPARCQQLVECDRDPARCQRQAPECNGNAECERRAVRHDHRMRVEQYGSETRLSRSRSRKIEASTDKVTDNHVPSNKEVNPIHPIRNKEDKHMGDAVLKWTVIENGQEGPVSMDIGVQVKQRQFGESRKHGFTFISEKFYYPVEIEITGEDADVDAQCWFFGEDPLVPITRQPISRGKSVYRMKPEERQAVKIVYCENKEIKCVKTN